MKMNRKKAHKVCWYVLFGTASILGIPGLILGTVLYLLVSLICSVITCFSVIDFLNVYAYAMAKFFRFIKGSLAA